MPRIAPARPTLRLVNDGPSPSAALSAERNALDERRARAIEAENRFAASLPAEDARVIFATEVAGQLQGGLVALLTPERRRRLMNRADGLGLRAFDANLIIAIVQDRARCGEFDPDAAADLRLALLRPPGEPRSQGSTPVWMLMLAAVALAGVLLFALVLWLRAAA